MFVREASDIDDLFYLYMKSSPLHDTKIVFDKSLLHIHSMRGIDVGRLCDKVFVSTTV